MDSESDEVSSGDFVFLSTPGPIYTVSSSSSDDINGATDVGAEITIHQEVERRCLCAGVDEQLAELLHEDGSDCLELSLLRQEEDASSIVSNASLLDEPYSGGSPGGASPSSSILNDETLDSGQRSDVGGSSASGSVSSSGRSARLSDYGTPPPGGVDVIWSTYDASYMRSRGKSDLS